jgi:hypothetical protein
MLYRLDKPSLCVKGDERWGENWLFRLLTLPIGFKLTYCFICRVNRLHIVMQSKSTCRRFRKRGDRKGI